MDNVIFMMHSISCVAKYIQNSVNNLHYKVGNAKMNLVKIFWKVPIWIRPAYVRWQAGEFRDTSCKEILKCDSKFSRPLALKSNPFLIRKSTNSICRLSIWSLFSSSFFVLNTLSHTLLNLLVWYHVIYTFFVVPPMFAEFIITWKYKCSGIAEIGEVHGGDKEYPFSAALSSYLFLVSCYMDVDFLLQWFNDVFSTEISETCGKILNLLLDKHGCEVSP